jgi:hypothetical protein
LASKAGKAGKAGKKEKEKNSELHSSHWFARMKKLGLY